jgi:exodeoxyribonuclease-3
MKIVTYNLNGIRSAIGKNWMSWMSSTDADIYCVQETKAHPDQLDHVLFEVAGYKTFWCSAQKKGYSGVAIMSKKEPKHVEYGCGNSLYDDEGRVIRADFDDYSVISVYMPSGTTGDVRQDFKMHWLAFFQDYVNELRKSIPNLLICGDFNICHQAIDIHDPIRNADSSGFKPEERDWMCKFVDAGFIDTFRHLNKDPHHYTWWSFRSGARKNNKGWRIDYIMASEPLKDKISRSHILADAVHSDHCPVMVELDLSR